MPKLTFQWNSVPKLTLGAEVHRLVSKLFRAEHRLLRFVRELRFVVKMPVKLFKQLLTIEFPKNLNFRGQFNLKSVSSTLFFYYDWTQKLILMNHKKIVRHQKFNFGFVSHVVRTKKGGKMNNLPFQIAFQKKGFTNNELNILEHDNRVFSWKYVYSSSLLRHVLITKPCHCGNILVFHFTAVLEKVRLNLYMVTY